MSKKYTTNFLEDTNGSTGSANQVLVSTASGVDWVDGSGSGIIGGPYLPLAGGTMTGDIVMNANKITFNSSTAPMLVGDRSTTNLDSRFSSIEGAWSYTTFDSGTTNQPPGVSNNANGVTTMNSHTGGYGQQIAFTNQNRLYTRQNAAGTISSWNEIYTPNTFANNSTEWNTAYDNSITALAFSGTSTTTLTLTQQDGGTVLNTFSNPQGTVTGATSGNANTITVSTSSTSPVVTPVTGAVNISSAKLATGAQIQTAINTATTGVLSYQGTWNASTNSPALASGVGTPGYYYIVDTAGSTNLDGITDWAVGDWAVFSDLATDAWQKIDNTQVGNVTGSGVNNRLAYWNSTSNINSDGNFTISGTRLIGTQLAVGDGTDGYFYSDSAGRTAFASGDFYIQSSVGNFYNYAANNFHGSPSGDNQLFRGNPLTGDNWSIATTGIITAPGGNSTEWNTAYDNQITAFTDSGTSTVTLTLTQQDGGTLSTAFSVPQGTVTGTGVATRVAFWSGTSTIGSNSDLYWDNTNNRLGIGTATPSTDLQVIGTVRADVFGVQDDGSNPSNNTSTRVTSPAGATYDDANNSLSTGILSVIFPTTAASTMLSFTLRVYDYANNESFDVNVAGYWYGSNLWTNTSVRIESQGDVERNFNVRFGKNSANKGWVGVGETTTVWSYVKFAVLNFQAAHVNDDLDRWDDNWDTAVLTSLTGYTVLRTWTDNQVNNWKRSGQNLSYGSGTGTVTVPALTTTGDITVSGGDIVLGGTGRIQGVDTVSASTDAANKAYVDAHVTPAGTYLPLAGGVMTGKIKRSTAIVGFLEGSYNNVGANGTNTNPIYTIGSSYNPASTTLSNMYGVGYSNAAASFITLTGVTDWGFYVAADGAARVWLDGNSGNISHAGDLYVGGGDIVLAGTGRIQGVDTVSASTDAANKAYVDAHPAGTVTSIATTNGIQGGTITSTGTLSLTGTYTGRWNGTTGYYIKDTRAGDITPANSTDNAMNLGFTNQVPGNGNWQSYIQMKGWSDGYASWQIIGPSTTTAYQNWYLRSGVGTTWNATREIFTTSGGTILGATKMNDNIVLSFGTGGATDSRIFYDALDLNIESQGGKIFIVKDVTDLSTGIVLDTSGNVAIGAAGGASASGAKLTVTGNAYVSGTVQAEDIFMTSTAASGAGTLFVVNEATQLVTRTTAQVLSDIGGMSGFGVSNLPSGTGTTFTITNGQTVGIVGGTNIQSVVNTTNETITLNYTGGTGSGSVTSVGLTSQGDAIAIIGTPVTTSGNLGITFQGDTDDYINGEGDLVSFTSAAIQLTSVQYGSGVTLSESSDRADLLYINSSTSGWGGLQIGNTSNDFIFSLMGDGSVGGIYDDQNNDWIIQWTENNAVRLYYNAVTKLATTSTGVTIAGRINMTWGLSVFIGQDAGIADDATNNLNVGVGCFAMSSNTTGSANVAVGYESLKNNTTGQQNSAIGYATMRDNTTGSFNTAFGGGSLLLNTTGSSNTTIGCNSLRLLTTGNNNVSVGRDSMYFGTTAYDNVGIGYASLRALTTGALNVGVGSSSLINATTAVNNVAVGAYALQTATTGSSNVAIGRNSMYSNSTGGFNVAVGMQALNNNNSSFNTAVGHQSLLSNSTGNYNTASGFYSLRQNTTGSNNAALGYESLRFNTTGIYNAAVGPQALYSNTTGGFNTAIGAAAGYNLVTGSNNTFLGREAQPSTTSVSNEITLGNTSITALRCNVQTISSLSDLRDKKEIENLKNAELFIKELRPVSFTWNQRDGRRVNTKDIGFIAQELLEAQVKANHKIPNLVLENNPNKLEAAYVAMLPSVVSALQSALIKIEQLEQKINNLENK